jgi:hypothetical protein
VSELAEIEKEIDRLGFWSWEEIGEEEVADATASIPRFSLAQKSVQ